MVRVVGGLKRRIALPGSRRDGCFPGLSSEVCSFFQKTRSGVLLPAWWIYAPALSCITFLPKTLVSENGTKLLFIGTSHQKCRGVPVVPNAAVLFSDAACSCDLAHLFL